ncbi:hypothetical protein J437_LFUL008924, partial [Ladona fulva]
MVDKLRQKSPLNRSNHFILFISNIRYIFRRTTITHFTIENNVRVTLIPECGIPYVGHRIVGGSETKINKYGWMAMLLHNNNFYCGGALISRNFVLTAAHCVNGISLNRMGVRLLEHDRSTSSESSPITVGVAEVIMHKNYKSSTFNNDIALVRLKREMDIDGAL